MDESSRIALGIVAAAALLLVGAIGYKEYARQRDIRDAQQAIQAIVQMGQRSMAQSSAQSRGWNAQQDARAQVARARAAVESSRYDLSSDQRCVGGVVIEVHGTVYTQVGGISDPIRCSGRRADRRLR